MEQISIKGQQRHNFDFHGQINYAFYNRSFSPLSIAVKEADKKVKARFKNVSEGFGVRNKKKMNVN
jgi:hypothetical protein